MKIIHCLVSCLVILALLSACGGRPTPSASPTSLLSPALPTPTRFRLPTPWSPTATPIPTPSLTPTTPPPQPTSLVVTLLLSDTLQILWQSGGELVDFAAAGEEGYLLVGPRLSIVDLADPAAPALLWRSEMLPAVGRALALDGDRLFLLTSGGEVQVWEVVRPAMPVLAGVIPVPDGSYALAAQGNRLFLAEWRCSAQICAPYLLSLDLTDLDAPRTIAEMDLEARPTELHPAGEWLYAFMRQSLQVIDLSEPFTPTVVSQVAGGSLTTAAFDLPLVYLSGSPSILDFTEPVSPQIVSTAKFLFPSPLALVDGRLFGFYTKSQYDDLCYSWLQQIEVTQPLTPTRITDNEPLPPLRCASQVQAVDDRLYVQDWDGLEVIDLSQPLTPTLLASLPAALDGAGPVGQMLFYEDHLLWGNGRGPDSLHTLKLDGLEYSGPFTPQVNQLIPYGQVLYAPLGMSGLGVFTGRDPASPQLVARIPVEELRGPALNAARVGAYLYLATGDSGVQVLSLADPQSPVRVGGYRLSSGGNWAVRAAPEIVGDRAYLVEQDNSGETYLGRLRVLDLSDPVAPVSLGEYDLGQPFAKVALAIEGETLYLALAGCYNGPCDQDFLALDVSDPAHPTQRFALDLPEGAYDVQLNGSLAWIAAGASGVWLLDVSTTSPQILAHLDTPGFAQGIALDSGRIFIGDGPGGVLEVRKP